MFKNILSWRFGGLIVVGLIIIGTQSVVAQRAAASKRHSRAYLADQPKMARHVSTLWWPRITATTTWAGSLMSSIVDALRHRQ